MYALVFGESVLNDAVAIVLSGFVKKKCFCLPFFLLKNILIYFLYRSIQNYGKHYSSTGGFETTAFFHALGDFCSIFMLSLLIGASMGCVTALMTKFTKVRDFPLLESALFVLMSYSTFLIAEATELTGLTVKTSNYTGKIFDWNCDRRCRCCTILWHLSGPLHLQQFIGWFSDKNKANFWVVKLFVGEFHFFLHWRFDVHLSQTSFWSVVHDNRICKWFCFWMMAFHLIIPKYVIPICWQICAAIGRAANIYPLSFLLNLGRQPKISMNFQHMLFFAGLSLK